MGCSTALKRQSTVSSGEGELRWLLASLKQGERWAVLIEGKPERVGPSPWLQGKRRCLLMCSPYTLAAIKWDERALHKVSRIAAGPLPRPYLTPSEPICSQQVPGQIPTGQNQHTLN